MEKFLTPPGIESWSSHFTDCALSLLTLTWDTIAIPTHII